jgi:metal-responsive CopG/Arc/MetJ family transcriptional regulator
LHQRLSISIDEKLVMRMDKERGLAPRSAVIGEIIKNAYEMTDEETEGAC